MALVEIRDNGVLLAKFPERLLKEVQAAAADVELVAGRLVVAIAGKARHALFAFTILSAGDQAVRNLDDAQLLACDLQAAVVAAAGNQSGAQHDERDAGVTQIRWPRNSTDRRY